ncbi:MAG: hypothetical protein V4548_06280 [Bacteroidota bacterium]
MSHKKNIERLFQEKFKDFEVEPPARVWNSIESQLKGKPARKIIPLWWKVSGIAAALLIGSLISYPILNSDNTNSVTNTESNANVVENNGAIENGETPKTDNAKTNKDLNSIQSNTIVSAPNQSGNSTQLAKKNSKTTVPLQIKKGFNTNKNNVANRYPKNYFNHNQSNKAVQQQSKNRTIAIAATENTTTNIIDPIIDYKGETQNPVAISSPNEAIKKDSVTTPIIAAITENPLEELLKEKQAKTATNNPKAKMQRWQVSSNASPVYYNSASQGSPLDVEFQNNAKEYKTNLGFGIGVKYALNKKFSLKTGANAVAMEYNTNDVVFSQESFSNSINSLNTNLEGSFLQIQTRSVSFANTETKFDGKLNQKTSYYEVPFELSYKVMDRKFGIEVIGGFSTLFLNENKVSLLSSGLNLNIGEANNLRQIHYSTNIGLGFKYSFWKSFQANFEPMFKYQINTFSSNSGNFKPYVLGLYTGISYSF